MEIVNPNTKPIYSEEQAFLELIYNTNALDWYKETYSDVCTDTDIKINRILDKMIQQVENESYLNIQDILDAISGDIELFKMIVAHMETFYQDYQNGLEPNPFWWD